MVSFVNLSYDDELKINICKSMFVRKKVFMLLKIFYFYYIFVCVVMLSVGLGIIYFFL